MNPSIRLRRVGRSAALLGLLLAAAATESRAAEITAFATGADPGATWKTGYGGMLTITLFNIVGGELEGAYQGGEFAETSIVSGLSLIHI